MINPDKNDKYGKVRALRKEGKGFSFIAKNTQTPKSTIRLWCKDITLTKTQKNALASKRLKSSMKTIIKVQQKRRDYFKEVEKEMNQLGLDDLKTYKHSPLFFLSLGLYWGEGYKKGNKEIAITNSDPRIINIVIKFFKEIYNTDGSSLKARLTINSLYKNDIDTILKYWSNAINIPLSNFTKTSYVVTPFKRKYPNLSHKGTIRV